MIETWIVYKCCKKPIKKLSGRIYHIPRAEFDSEKEAIEFIKNGYKKSKK